MYAAGPCTRYHKRYYGDSRSHKYYDRYELGEKVGVLVKAFFMLTPMISLHHASVTVTESSGSKRITYRTTMHLLQDLLGRIGLRIGLLGFQCSIDSRTKNCKTY